MRITHTLRKHPRDDVVLSLVTPKKQTNKQLEIVRSNTRLRLVLELRFYDPFFGLVSGQVGWVSHGDDTNLPFS